MWCCPIRVETERYENLSVDERKCNNVEDEGHILFNCHLYEDIRLQLIKKATILEPNFTNLSDLEKLKLVFTKSTSIRLVADTCYTILKRRMFLYYIILYV